VKARRYDFPWRWAKDHSGHPFEGEKQMKRLTVFVFALLLGASLSFAQTGGGTTKGTTTTSDKGNDKDKGKDKGKEKSGKKGHKGGKKGKKGSTTPATPPK
jgi:hypothetical protein